MNHGNGESNANRIFFILNPVAGHFQADVVEQTFNEIFDQNGIAYDIYQTTGDEQLPEIVKNVQQKGYHLIVAGGGDGTVSEVATGLLNSDIPLGILPLGTGNLVARELGIPLELDDACRLLVGDHTATYLDAMQLGQQAYLPHIGLGLYARIIEHAAVEEKRRFGMLAYLWRALQEISGRQGWTLTIAVDDQEQRVRASLIMIANIGAIGIGEARWGEKIRPDDGEIDVCIISAMAPADYLSVLSYLLRWQPQPAEITYLRAKREIVITATRPIPVRISGKTVEQSTVQIKIIPHAIKTIVPLAAEGGTK